MQNISSLLQQYETAWFWIDEQYQDCFFQELTKMNATFVNGSPVTRESIRHCMGVHSDMTVGYVSHLVWHQTFFSPSAPVKVDYGKYLQEQDDFIFREPNIQPLDLSRL